MRLLSRPVGLKELLHMKTRSLAVFINLLLVGVFVSGCQTRPEILYDNPAFSVIVPEGWKSGKVKEPSKSRNFRQLGILKQGAASVAEVNISWYDELLDLQSTITNRMGMIEDKRFFKVRFDEIVDGSYGEYEGLMARSNEEKWGLELQVEMYCFHANGKTFVIWTGDAVEDLEMHSDDFQLMEDSFSVQ